MRINKKYKVREIAGEKIVIIQGEYGVDFTRIISLNQTSNWLWQLFIDKEFKLEDIKEALLSRFNVGDDQAMSDAKAWVDKMLEYNLIED
ncbi:MAG: PqqD family protein [Bacteroidales bacterium]|nr:PqqD family protein [Bacteroidales bacterium]